VTDQRIQQEAICYQWFKQRLILSVSKPSISQQSQITEVTVEPSVSVREFNLKAYAAITWHNDPASLGLELRLADHRSQVARTSTLPTAASGQACPHASLLKTAHWCYLPVCSKHRHMITWVMSSCELGCESLSEKKLESLATCRWKPHGPTMISSDTLRLCDRQTDGQTRRLQLSCTLAQLSVTNINKLDTFWPNIDNRILKFLDWVLFGNFHWENVLNFHGTKNGRHFERRAAIGRRNTPHHNYITVHVRKLTSSCLHT